MDTVWVLAIYSIVEGIGKYQKNVEAFKSFMKHKSGIIIH